MASATDRVVLGRSGVEVTRLGVGTGPLGGLFEAVSDEDAAAALERAFDLGIRYFDTAPLYGRGEAERRLGRFLAGGRAGCAVSTKVGRLLVERPAAGDRVERSTVPFRNGPPLVPVWDFGRAGVRRSLEASLERLGLDRVDLLLLHDVSGEAVDEALAGGIPELERARAEGLVRALGAGTGDLGALERLAREARLDCFLVPGRYTLLDRSGEVVLDECAERGVTVIVAGVFASGVLADPDTAPRYDYEPAPPAIVERARSMAAACAEHEVPLAAAALQLPLRHPAVGAVLAGVRTAAEVDADVAAFEQPIPDALWGRLLSRRLRAYAR